jgi:hypothetical protein
MPLLDPALRGEKLDCYRKGGVGHFTGANPQPAYISFQIRSSDQPAVIDPYLAAIARAVEGGAALPQFAMALTSGDLVRGTPRPSHEFVEGTHQALTVVPKAAEGGLELWRRKAEERASAVSKELKGAETNSAEPVALTLVEATVLWSGRGNGARMPVVRVDLDSVALWWIAGEKRVKGDTSMFFGVAFPIG